MYKYTGERERIKRDRGDRLYGGGAVPEERGKQNGYIDRVIGLKACGHVSFLCCVMFAEMCIDEEMRD